MRMKNRSVFLKTAVTLLCAAVMMTGLAGCVRVTVNVTDNETEEDHITTPEDIESMVDGIDSAFTAEFYASNDYYKVTMPMEWYDRVEVEEVDGDQAAERGAVDTVSFYSTVCKEAGDGGHIATIVLSEERPEALEYIPGEAIGVLTEASSGRTLNVWVEYPSDVQGGPDTMDEYAELSEGRGTLAETFEPAEGWTLERMTLDEMMAE